MTRSNASSELPVQKILCYGRDGILLQTRQWLVERDGFACVLAGSEAEFLAKLGSHNPDLIMLCQTLSKVECDCAKAIASQLVPAARVLVLVTRSSTCAEDGDTVLNTAEGPEQLLRTAERLLSERYAGKHEPSLTVFSLMSCAA